LERGGEPSCSRWTGRSETGALLGEMNDSQREAWRRTIEVFEDGSKPAKTMALFPEDRTHDIDDEQVVKIRLKEMELRRPNSGCMLAAVCL